MKQDRRDKIKDLIKKMGQFEASGIGDKPQRTLMAQIQTEIAEEQSEMAEKSDRHTRHLICLTWAIVSLTFVLLLFTIYLYQDGHAAAQREQTAQQHSNK